MNAPDFSLKCEQCGREITDASKLVIFVTVATPARPTPPLHSLCSFECLKAWAESGR